MTTVSVKDNKIQAVNRSMKKFLLTFFLLVVAWQLLYLCVLKPVRIPDAFLTHALTSAVTATINVFFSLSPQANYFIDTVHGADHIQQHGRTILSIFDDCNGLELYLIYLSFIWLLPASAKRKTVFSIIGIAAIFISNIGRCVALYWIYIHYRRMFDFNHHYSFTIVMYLVILLCWAMFIRKPRLNEAD